MKSPLRMMRVELVEHSPNSPTTGIGRYTHTLAAQLSRYPAYVQVRRTTNLDPPLAHRFTTLHHLPRGVAQHQAGAIVHFQQIMGCAQMLWNPTRPAIATVHDLGGLVWTPEWQQRAALDRAVVWLSLQGLRRMDRLIADSEYTRQGLIRQLHIAPERVHTIHLGVDHAHFTPHSPARSQFVQRYQLRPDARYLLYVGNEQPRKNIATLLRALAQVRQHTPNVHLLKVGGAGGAAYRSATEQLIAQLGLHDAVHLVGHIPETELPLFYDAAELYVQPSFLEGFGLPVLEAMACGVPVLCAAAGALPEIGYTAAAYFDPHDASDCAARISTLLHSPHRLEQLRTAGYARAAGFTWERTALATLGVYRRVG
ncbi:MAG: glycosyltransferase family 4 protein [Chloroflexaceae bacterium]|nr:glycosyltransferase family 4 protein [Chloroflexaceae bacterium]